MLAIVFTCNHCPTAQLYESRIKKLADDYRGKSVTLVAIEPNDPEAVWLSELGYTDVSDSFEEMKIRAAYRHFIFLISTTGKRNRSRARMVRKPRRMFSFSTTSGSCATRGALTIASANLW